MREGARETERRETDERGETERRGRGEKGVCARDMCECKPLEKVKFFCPCATGGCASNWGFGS